MHYSFTVNTNDICGLSAFYTVAHCGKWVGSKLLPQVLVPDYERRGIGLAKRQLGRRSMGKGGHLKVQSLPIHDSLRPLLDIIIIDGDSEALKKTIDVHVESYL